MKKKGFLAWDQLFPWLLAIFVLVLVLGFIFYTLSPKSSSALEYIKAIFKI